MNNSFSPEKLKVSRKCVNFVLIAVSKRELLALADTRYDIQLAESIHGTGCVWVSSILIRVSSILIRVLSILIRVPSILIRVSSILIRVSPSLKVCIFKVKLPISLVHPAQKEDQCCPSLPPSFRRNNIHKICNSFCRFATAAGKRRGRLCE